MKNTIIISDTHFPYEHRDTFPFLKALKDYWDIEDAKHTGDIVDNHFGSFHNVEQECLSAPKEHKLACKKIKKLEEIFPELTVVLGNHDILSERKAIAAGIQLPHLRSFNDRYDVNWKWKEEDFFKVDQYNHCLLKHSISASTVNNAAKFSHCSIQGHHHSVYGIHYSSDSHTLRWSATVGCLIDAHSPAFNYDRAIVLKRAVIGCMVMVDNNPVLTPMRLTKSGRWNNII